MKIVFIDKNESLVAKVKKAVKYLPFKVTAKCGDIFKEKGVIVSASNPMFSMGGGLDALIAEKYPKECGDIDRKEGDQRHGNVIFAVTVGEDFKATRELVESALNSALDCTEKDETVLISGLGTGIGGLDEDDFVWIFLKVLCKYHGYGCGIKFTQKDGFDFRTGKVFYEVGKWLEQKGAKNDGEECGVGLHLGKSFIGAGNYNTPDKIFFCLFEKKDFCGEGDDKIRVSKLLTVCELPQWLGYGKNGKKIVGKIGESINPEDYNPYQATKLPTIEAIKDKMKNPLAQVGDQVWAQVRAQVGDQVWAVSYWSVNIHFELGISHWFGDFLSLGIMPIFVNGKMKVFGKKGMYLGEYDDSELFGK